jgi:vitamin B12/bleomycin/antimicrobial peptide transport system ATP-binding/permease protein
LIKINLISPTRIIYCNHFTRVRIMVAGITDGKSLPNFVWGDSTSGLPIDGAFSENGRGNLSRFWVSASGFWRGKSALVGWSLTVVLIVMGIAQLAVQYRLNYWNKDFFNALQFHDAHGLLRQSLIFVPLAIISISLKVAAVWGRMTMQRKWREWLTTDVLHTWLFHNHYRQLEGVAGEYKNAEYRISYDAKTATDAPVDLALGIVTSALTAVIFLDVLWDVGGSIRFAARGMHLAIPGYLVVGVIIYSVLFTGLMLAIGQKLSAVIQAQSQTEAEFLAATNQIRIADRSNLVANEIQQAWDTFREVLEAWRRLCWRLMGTTFVSQTDLLLAPVFAWILCAPKYLSGAMTLGDLMQASAAFVTVQISFTWLVDNYQRLADWRAAVTRVATLLLALDEVSRREGVEAIKTGGHK